MNEFVRLAKALADESRLQILWMLEDRELCVCEIKGVMDLAQSTVSRHLKILESAGFVVSERIGLWKNFYLNPVPQPLVQTLLAQVRIAAEHEPQALALRERAAVVQRDKLCFGLPVA